MRVLVILAVLLILLLILPVGAEIRYADASVTWRARAGPLRIRAAPKRRKKPKADAEPAQEQSPQKNRSRPRPGLAELLQLVGIARKALGRSFRHLSVDTLHVTVVAAAPDPYDAVMRYGSLNAGVSVLSPLLHRALRIRDERITVDLDMNREAPVIEAYLVATIQIWELLYIGGSAGFALLRWLFLLRRADKQSGAQNAEQKG